jgi:hypothetical protein
MSILNYTLPELTRVFIVNTPRVAHSFICWVTLLADAHFKLHTDGAASMDWPYMLCVQCVVCASPAGAEYCGNSRLMHGNY